LNLPVARCWAGLAGFLAGESGARSVEVEALEKLAGGAIQENWGFVARFDDGPFDGEHRLVLRTDAATGVANSLRRIEEFAVLQAAHVAGVTVPEPLWVCPDTAIIGRPFFVMRRLPGTPQGREITTDPTLEPHLADIAARLGRELARIQTVRPPRSELDFLPVVDAASQIAGFRVYLDRHPRPRPVLEWAIRWLETHLPDPLPPVLCHRDFRTGNYLIDVSRLTAILDWEFAGWGDPDEDIGWLCCKGWRFARLDRELGGIAGRAPFYEAYEAASGRRLDAARVHFWEVFANVRWAIIALQQSDRHLIGGARDLSTAIIGRRATECDLELLMLLDPGGAPSLPGVDPAAADPLRDFPSGPALAALGREWMLRELLPLAPPEHHRDLRLAATAISIAAREATAGHAPLRAISEGLENFYRERAPLAALLARFALALRTGAFELCEPRARAARAILWHLTMLKLREANPGFLAANGFGD